MPKADSLSPELIRVDGRVREMSEDAVVRLMGSIQSIGLQTPISVRWADEDDAEFSAVLIAGLHRLEACRRLAVPTVAVMVHDWSVDQARMWEIAENLHRADLTALERSEHIAEWVKLSGASCATKPGAGRHSQGGVRAATRDLGIDRTEAQRSVKVASLSPDAKQAARDAGLSDNRTALLQAAQHPPERQADAIRTYEPSKSKPAPAVKNAFESEEDWRRALFTVWNRGAQDWRERALEQMDTPVFDRTRAA